MEWNEVNEEDVVHEEGGGERKDTEPSLHAWPQEAFI